MLRARRAATHHHEIPKADRSSACSRLFGGTLVVHALPARSLVQMNSQCHACPMQLRLRRANGNAKQLADLFMAVPFDIMKHEYGPRAGWQPLHCAIEIHPGVI